MPPKKKTPAAPAEEAIVPPAPAPVEPAAPIVPQPIVVPTPVAPVAPSAPASDKPGMVTAVAVLTLVSGIVNIIAGLVAAVSLASTVILLCLAPLGLLPIALGIYEIVYAAKLLPTPIQRVQPSQTIAILEIVCFVFGNIISAVAGILALVFYADPGVKAYFAKINGQA